MPPFGQPRRSLSSSQCEHQTNLKFTPKVIWEAQPFIFTQVKLLGSWVHRKNRNKVSQKNVVAKLLLVLTTYNMGVVGNPPNLVLKGDTPCPNPQPFAFL
jgi:hypothetical protein